MADAPDRAGAPALQRWIAEARAGKGAAVYLFEGDAFLSLRAGRELAQALVPEARRALNLVELDPAASPGEVAAELATPGLFGGAKVVLLQEPAFLSPKEDARESFDAARRLWAEGRQREAARRLLTVAARAGWTAPDLAAPERPSSDDWRRELGVDADDAAIRSFVAQAARYALEKELRLGGEGSGALEALLARGLPPGHVLIVAAQRLDGRLPLVRKLAAAGRSASTAVPVEGRWNAQRPALGPVIASLLEGTGKEVDRGGEVRLAELVGDDARTLAAEVAKLVAYVGERRTIQARDVDALVARTAADAFFALGNAVEARDLGAALGVLSRSLADGASPVMLVGSLAATVRRLVVERERARLAAGGRRLTSFEDWSDAVLPAIPEEELGQRKPFGFWMKYQAAMRFSRGELLAMVADLADADLGMKSGGDGPLLLERILLRRLAPGGERSTA